MRNHIMNDSAEIISGENHRDAAKPGKKKAKASSKKLHSTLFKHISSVMK